MTKSTTTHFTLKFVIFLLIFFFLPHLSQQLPWGDHHLRVRELDPQTEASVENAFTHFTQLMEANPQLYGFAVLFPHFYQQLWDCTEWEEENNHVYLTVECHVQLLSFFQDLGLLPERYRSPARTIPPRRPQLEEDWQTFISVNPPPPVEQGPVMPLVTDHPVVVPPEQLPLLEGCPHLQLTNLLRGGATVSYISLKNEFLRNQAVYATKEVDSRKRSTLTPPNPQSQKRLLKLRAIFLMMEGQDLAAAVNPHNAAANAAAADDDDDTDNDENDHQLIPAPAPNPVPNPQQVPWDDNYLQTVQLTPQTVTSVENSFAHFTQLMEGHPQTYGFVIFSHLYPQLVDCIVRREGNQAHRLSAECHAQLLTFLQDLDLLPEPYHSRAGRRRTQLDDDWQTFIEVNPPPPGPVMPLVPDHTVMVPPEQLPLLEGCPNLQLTILPEGGGTTVSYRSLVEEFLRNQAVYATKNIARRKHSALKEERPQSQKRLLKLRAIFIMMVGRNLATAVDGPHIAAAATAANAAAADDIDHDETDLLGFLDEIDFSDWPIEDDGQNANDDHQLIPAPATPFPAAVRLYETSPFVPDIEEAGSGGLKRPFEEEDDDPENWYKKYYKELEMRSMGKKEKKFHFFKMASFLLANRGLVTSLLTLGLTFALIAIIWTLYSVNGRNSSQQKDEEKETTSATTMTTNDDI